VAAVFFLRPMQAADLPALLALEAENPAPWSAAQLAAELGVETGWQFVAIPAGGEAPCAFLCGRSVAGEAEILRLAVARSWRRQGVAGLLLTHCLDFLARSGVARVFLEVRAANAPARALYEKFDFRQAGLRKNYYAAPKDHAIVMSRQARSGVLSAGQPDMRKNNSEGASLEKHQGS
jgi:[ribosomal protein S18]-alanine N-acetyltransferase